MLTNIEIILAKANWCGHCKNFEKIYKYSQDNYKEYDEEFKNLNLVFSDHDLALEDVRDIFMINYPKAMEFVEGYPTVLLKIKDKYLIVEHTILDENQDKENQVSDASKRFLENISNVIKSLNSENKILYTKSGGSSNIYKTSLEEETYRKKYIKYKSKYLKLKIKL